MGIIASTSRKTENSEKSGRDSWESVAPEVVAFMEKGGCKEPYMAYVDCSIEAEKKNEDGFGRLHETNEDIGKCTKAFTMLMKCMDAHSDYYQPILDAVYDGEDLYLARLINTLRGDSKKI
ncbi:hypothetical protein N665_0588s0027 [Sinapis alba]|nr:hypothetical protein N665_0588s0027 [Sinapis alba]